MENKQNENNIKGYSEAKKEQGESQISVKDTALVIEASIQVLYFNGKWQDWTRCREAKKMKGAEIVVYLYAYYII